MSSLAKAVHFEGEMLWVDLLDGRTLGVPLAYFPRLLRASPEQRTLYEISGGGSGLHWPELDEDILVAGLLAGIGDQTNNVSVQCVGSRMGNGGRTLEQAMRRPTTE